MLHRTDISAPQANERCAVLLGGQRFATVLRGVSPGRFVIAGWPGLVLGTRLHLILDRGRSVVQECEVVGATALGIELSRVEAPAPEHDSPEAPPQDPDPDSARRDP
jgi:hypothetical protein